MSDPTSFSYQLIDDQGLSNNVQLFVAYDGAVETIDSMIGAWSAFGGLIDACVDGQIVGGHALIPLLPNVAWKSAPAVGNNVNQVMALNFDNDFNSYATGILLPSYKETQVSATPPRAPNLSATALAAFIAAIIGGSGNFFPNSRDLHDLNALRDAFLTTRKVRQQRARTKVTP